MASALRNFLGKISPAGQRQKMDDAIDGPPPVKKLVAKPAVKKPAPKKPR